MLRHWPLTLRGTSALFVAAASFLLAAATGLIELVMFAALLLVLVAVALVSLFLTGSPATVRRSLAPATVPVGGTSRVRVEVGVRALLPTMPGTWSDDVGRGLEAQAEGDFSGFRSGVGGDEHVADFAYPVMGVRRGIRSLGPLRVHTTDPFGLARRSRRIAGTTEVTVTPAVRPLPDVVDLPGEMGGMLTAALPRLGQGADDLIARPYAPGDSMRRIHWRATAHRDQLMVRQEERETAPRAHVIFDVSTARYGPAAAREPGVDAGFEAAVEAVLSVTALFVGEGFTVSIINSTGAEIVEDIAGFDRAALDTLASRLATVVSAGNDQFADVVRQFAESGAGPVVVITGELDAAAITLLAPLAAHSSLAVVMSTTISDEGQSQLRGLHVGRIGGARPLADSWAGTLERGVQ